LTRTVRDAARYLDVVSGPHPDDLDSLDAPAGGFERELDDLPPVRRIGLSLDLGYASVEDEVKDLVATAARSIADEAGAELTSVPPLFQDPFPTWAVIASAGDAALHATWTDEQREMAERGYIAFGAQGYALTAVQYADALQERHQLNRRINGFFADFDLLLTPAAPTTAWPAKGPTPQSIGGKAASPAAAVAFTYPFNITGHPAASVPAGLAANGLPVGLQVVGPRFRDSLVLQAAAAFEKAVGWDFPD
jgi:aspartyl-tRNA(Asn)/glutamyl-tRNA(Gln) amidotransferase subunit A